MLYGDRDMSLGLMMQYASQKTEVVAEPRTEPVNRIKADILPVRITTGRKAT